MNLRRQRPEEPNLIDLAPLIDVVFILLIFFMVSTTFSRQSEIEVNLPEASAEQREEQPESLEVSVDVQGRYFIDGKPLIDDTLETLVNALRKESQGRRDLPLMISADGKAPHQAVISVMDAARQVGLVRISFATQQSPEKP
jgi:biopolymer transport protein ExbD